MVVDDETGKSVESDVRTSSGMFLDKAQVYWLTSLSMFISKLLIKAFPSSVTDLIVWWKILNCYLSRTKEDWLGLRLPQLLIVVAINFTYLSKLENEKVIQNLCSFIHTTFRKKVVIYLHSNTRNFRWALTCSTLSINGYSINVVPFKLPK